MAEAFKIDWMFQHTTSHEKEFNIAIFGAQNSRELKILLQIALIFK